MCSATSACRTHLPIEAKVLACRWWILCGFPLLKQSEDFWDPKDADRHSQQEGRIGGLGFQDVSEPDFRLRTMAL